MDDFLISKHKLILWVICALGLISLLASPVQAQDITLNVPLQGSLESGMSDSLNFLAKEGQMLSFIARGDNGLDPIITIEDFNGNELLRNDDYNYPTSQDALVEAFSAPYTGNYTLTISPYGNSSGNYELLMLSGYSEIALHETFDSGGNWSIIDLGSDIPAQLTIINGNANLIHEGLRQEAIAVGLDTDSDIYYVNARIASISGSRGWQVGLVFNYQDAGNYYQMLINQNGAWRMIKVDNREITILRNWNVHPAITPSDDSFDLGILVNGSGFDVFYDGQYIGSESDTTFQGGQVGLNIVTADALGSRVTARYDELLITRPLDIDGANVFPTQLVASNMNYILRELERRLLIPHGSEMAFILPESFVQNVSMGVSRFPIGNGQSVTNFALSSTITWAASGADLNGCGIAIDIGDSEDYILAYVDSTGGYGLAERQGNKFVQNIFNDNLGLQLPPHEIILIRNGDKVHYFVDDKHAASLTISPSEGKISEAIVNFEAANTNCQYDDLWVTQWP